MAIRFLTDSASDITPQEAEELGITVLPMTVSFGGEEYSGSADLSPQGFYEKLIESDTLPKTSQITPAVFGDAFEKLTADGDTVIAVVLSSKLSGTVQSACIAAADFPGRVFVVDSLSATVGERILVQTGLKYAQDGLSAEEIAARLEQDREKVCILALLDTLEYLKKGGRISSAVALAGSLLSIKPVITIENGSVSLVGKARGSRNGANLLRKMISDVGGIDFSRPFSLVYSGLSDSLLRKYIEDSQDLWNDSAEDLPVSYLGAVLGTHIGPGAIGIAFFRK